MSCCREAAETIKREVHRQPQPPGRGFLEIRPSADIGRADTYTASEICGWMSRIDLLDVVLTVPANRIWALVEIHIYIFGHLFKPGRPRLLG